MILADAHYLYMFECYVWCISSHLPVVAVAILWWWSRQRSPDGPRLAFCISALVLALPLLRYFEGALRKLIFSREILVTSYWAYWPVRVFIAAAYVSVLVALTRILLRKWRESQPGLPVCPRCGTGLAGPASSTCPQCARRYEIVPRYEVRLCGKE
jgi:cytochrome bd-type quinol oxidase subunit 2